MFLLLHLFQILCVATGLLLVASYLCHKGPFHKTFTYLKQHRLITLFALIVVSIFVFSERVSHHGMAITKENMYVNSFLVGSFFLIIVSKSLPRFFQITAMVMSSVIFLLSMWIFVPHIYGVLLTRGKRINVDISKATPQQTMLLDAATEKVKGSTSEDPVADVIRMNDLAMHLMIKGNYDKKNIRQFCSDLQSNGFGDFVSKEISKRCLKIFKEYRIKQMEYECFEARRTSGSPMRKASADKSNRSSIINKMIKMLSDDFWRNQRAIIAYMIADYYCDTNNLKMFETYSSLAEKAIGESCQVEICHASTKLLLSRCYEKFGFRWRAIKKRAEALSSLLDQREEERALRRLFWTGKTPDLLYAEGWFL